MPDFLGYIAAVNALGEIFKFTSLSSAMDYGETNSSVEAISQITIGYNILASLAVAYLEIMGSEDEEEDDGCEEVCAEPVCEILVDEYYEEYEVCAEPVCELVCPEPEYEEEAAACYDEYGYEVECPEEEYGDDYYGYYGYY